MLYPIAISTGDEDHAWGVVDIDVTKYLGKAQKLNITLPGYLLNRIDEYVLHHPEEKSRSGFLASAALKVLQQGR
jgi:hypothetical protein